MVMETPSAVCIGREFVRQYYTVLNRSPECLHRFYSQDSSFVHGGSEKHEKGACVTGQQDIHWRIMQLDFRDCHAKIRQVDSHSTLGDGVVVQVTGELSNAGQPMRRFMQTFVLAPQTPLKYYVRNDIFCYQDEVFTDNEEENGEESSVTCAEDGEEDAVQPSAPPAEEADHEMTNGVPASPSSPQQASTAPFYIQQEPVRNGTSQCGASEPLPPPPSTVQPVPVAHSPGPSEAAPPSPQRSPQPVVLAGQQQDAAAEDPAPSEWEEEDVPASSASVAAAPTTTLPSAGHQAAQEAKTYANMVSRNPAPGFTSLNQAPPAPFGGGAHVSSAAVTSSPRFAGETLGGPPPRGEQQQRFGSAPRMAAGRSRGGAAAAAASGFGQTPLPRRTTDQRDTSLNQGSPPGGSGEDGGLSMGGSLPQRKQQYPDSQQVFVGNLPHFISEDQVKERFGEFGKVLEFRINSKPSTKMPSGKVVPNCGFVVFDSAEAVQAALKNKDVMIDGHRLNVEEKKTKQRLAESRGGGPPYSSGPSRGGGVRAVGRGNGRGGSGSTFTRGAPRNPSSYGPRH